MSESSRQIHPNGRQEPQAPKIIWKSLLGRAVFGYFSEINCHSYFMNDDYLERLCEVENALERQYGKIVLYSAAFSLFAIATTTHALDTAQYGGLFISRIPLLSQFCTLVLGVLVALQCIFFLDITAVSMMRYQIFSTSGSESPSMRMVHWKGRQAWLDAALPKRVGYESGWAHTITFIFFIIWSLLLPTIFAVIPVAAQLICASNSYPANNSSLSALLVWGGLGISGLTVFSFFAAVLVPLPFRLRQGARKR